MFGENTVECSVKGSEFNFGYGSAAMRNCWNK